MAKKATGKTHKARRDLIKRDARRRKQAWRRQLMRERVKEWGGTAKVCQGCGKDELESPFFQEPNPQ